MAIIQGNSAVESGIAAYEIPNSLKFNSADSAYLSWTPASAGNRKTWTWSGWVKRGSLGSYQRLMTVTIASDEHLIFRNTDVFHYHSGNAVIDLITTQVFRDVSSWYHIVLQVDTTQATSSNRVKIYVNGVQVTAFSTATYPSLNAETAVNNTLPHGIGGADSSQYLNGYLTEVNFIDGQALDPTSFGEFNSETGVWQPIAYAGTYGTNGFYLPMTQDQIVEGFNTVLWRGNGGTQRITGVGFSPDLVWLKPRNLADHHRLTDSVRGARKTLKSNLTDAESSSTGNDNLYSFDADGFTIGSGDNGWNGSGYNYVGWCWDAGNSTVSNTDGTITSSVRASQTYGFSVVTYTGNGSGGATIGHGLGAVPKFVIVKKRSAIDSWKTYDAVGGPTKALALDSTGTYVTSTSYWNDTAPDSSVVTLGYGGFTNSSGDTYVAYCFAETGYSKFGSYTGNGSSTGPTVTLGWKPAFLLVKRTDSANDWYMIDNTRDADPAITTAMAANSSSQESSWGTSVTFTDTGFQPTTTAGHINASGGTYIYAAFKDQREAAFWRDFSGNGNHWQPNNLDFNDSVVDTPTQYGTDTGAGGEVRGNYATFNPIVNMYQDPTYSNGNLDAIGSGTDQWCGAISTIGVTSGKWYAEFTMTANGTSANLAYFGVTANPDLTAINPQNSGVFYYANNGNKRIDSTATSYGSSWTVGDVIGMALDIDGGTVTFYKNNTSQGSISLTSSSVDGKTIHPMVALYSADGGVINFGQRPFAYSAPTGYKSLCTTNLPDPAIADGSTAFNTVLYTGNGSTQSITGVGFQPDFTWIKNRNSTRKHMLQDAVRGAGYNLWSHLTDAEVYSPNWITSFDSDGFGVGTGSDLNQSTYTYAAWNWKAGGSGVSNTDGSITSTVSANPTAGFSIVTYTGTGSSGTVGHGLGVAPKMLILKDRTSVANWYVWHAALAANQFLLLNTTAAIGTSTTIWNNSLPTSTVFGSDNWSTDNIVVYAFAPVEGYSAFGSYVGNGSTDGPFIYTGFRPAFVLLKNATTAGVNWLLIDTKRDPYNAASRYLLPNLSDAEPSSLALDILSNGFKPRLSAATGMNSNGATYIYAAFAENPFKFSLAR